MRLRYDVARLISQSITVAATRGCVCVSASVIDGPLRLIEDSSNAGQVKGDKRKLEQEVAAVSACRPRSVYQGGVKPAANMPIDFYYLPPSPPCRSVMLLAKAIGVHLNLKTVNVLKGEHMKPEFLKINPQHVIPTMDDNGFVLCESRPIMGYLVSKYAKNDSLYPREPQKRGTVDEILYFDISSLFANIGKCYFKVMMGKTKTVQESDLANVENSCETLNTFLTDKKFVAGETLTIADFTVSTSICVLECFGFDIGRYDNVAAWYESCKQLLDKFGFEEVHAPGTRMFTEMYRANLQESS